VGGRWGRGVLVVGLVGEERRSWGSTVQHGRSGTLACGPRARGTHMSEAGERDRSRRDDLRKGLGGREISRGRRSPRIGAQKERARCSRGNGPVRLMVLPGPYVVVLRRRAAAATHAALQTTCRLPVTPRSRWLRATHLSEIRARLSSRLQTMDQNRVTG
jgi:hypothetical protein